MGARPRSSEIGASVQVLKGARRHRKSGSYFSQGALSSMSMLNSYIEAFAKKPMVRRELAYKVWRPSFAGVRRPSAERPLPKGREQCA
jgi:hypothetical protein